MILLDKAPLTILGTAALLILVAIPFALCRIPRNIAHGNRTRAPMANDDIWFEAIAYFGRGLSVSFLCGCFAAYIISLLQPWSPAVFIPVSILMFVGPSLAATIATWPYVRSFGASS